MIGEVLKIYFFSFYLAGFIYLYLCKAFYYLLNIINVTLFNYSNQFNLINILIITRGGYGSGGAGYNYARSGAPPHSSRY
jgi:hypothetical protein